MVLNSTDLCFFFFNVPAPTEIYTLSLHDALPISSASDSRRATSAPQSLCAAQHRARAARACGAIVARSEEHTSELQSHHDLVCRLLLEKKNISAWVKLRIVSTGSIFLSFFIPPVL